LKVKRRLNAKETVERIAAFVAMDAQQLALVDMSL
jgi:hypothetical protein